jgi:hypothetical protein
MNTDEHGWGDLGRRGATPTIYPCSSVFIRGQIKQALTRQMR